MTLYSIANAALSVSKYTIHNDLNILFVIEEMKKYSTLYFDRIKEHKKSLILEIINSPDAERRLGLKP